MRAGGFVARLSRCPADNCARGSSATNSPVCGWAADSARFFFEQEGLTGKESDGIAWPGRASIEDVRGLPDALIVVDGDVLRDEGEAYADKLMRAGVRVTSVRYSETTHDFAMLNPLANTPATRAAIQQAIDALKTALT